MAEKEGKAKGVKEETTGKRTQWHQLTSWVWVKNRAREQLHKQPWRKGRFSLISVSVIHGLC